MEGKKLHYKELLDNRFKNESLKKQIFYDEQKRIAESIVIEKIEFGNQIIIKEESFEPMVIFDMDWRKFEDQFVIELLESESGWKHDIKTEQKYIKTFILSRKDKDLNSLPICVQIVFYPTWLTLDNDNASFSCLGLSYPKKTEVYVYNIYKYPCRMFCFSQDPILVLDEIKPSKEILNKYIDLKKGETIVADLTNNSVIEGFLSITSLKNHFLSEDGCNLTLENVIENTIKKSIIEQFDLYCINKLDKPSNYCYTLMNDLIDVHMLIERKEFVSDVELGSRFHYTWGKLKNRKFETILVTTTITIKGTDYKKVLGYCGTNFIYDMDIKKLLTELLL